MVRVADLAAVRAEQAAAILGDPARALLTFGGQDKHWDGALAAVVEDGSEQVFVVMYDVPAWDEEDLDAWEGGCLEWAVRGGRGRGGFGRVERWSGIGVVGGVGGVYGVWGLRRVLAVL
ncbi:hypothetical protein [Actinomadura sp. GC306]|uniref:hypothetical protein n=1 Tax=Actinomadura sp. GC306 TaxID=2530367 RepID=UPI001FB5F3F3|nr:hypothetical protein [Actinomadura sp. GC306]